MTLGTLRRAREGLEGQEQQEGQEGYRTVTVWAVAMVGPDLAARGGAPRGLRAVAPPFVLRQGIYGWGRPASCARCCAITLGPAFLWPDK
ncbi:hypothetical protein [Chitinasiproducens palmae]|uniref:Uncharacterized protein n=1 Tax=Chitinasiproducens palmae TaxID=1770053 RepID=A0A1H2PUB4_9BURK|nr:hypothetical protein [Chitinasiproducens palmae]SDV50780.1 hypothetical protein SAMN05216551_113100 [Chitinasiproducens palmae]